MDSKQMLRGILVIVIGSVIGTLATNYVNAKLKDDCPCKKAD